MLPDWLTVTFEFDRLQNPKTPPANLLLVTVAVIVPDENCESRYMTNCPPASQLPSTTIPVSDPDGQLSIITLDVGVPHPEQPAMLMLFRRILTLLWLPSMEIPSL